MVSARSELTANLTAYIQGFPDLLVFGAADNKSRQITQNDQLYNSSQLQLARITGLQEAALILFSNLAMWLVLMYSNTPGQHGLNTRCDAGSSGIGCIELF